MENDCGLIPFDEVLKNKDKYIEMFSEGNIGLSNLLNYCFYNNIETLSCCGDSYPQIVFIITEENRNIMENLYGTISKLPDEDRQNIDATVCYSKCNDKELLDININTTIEESIKYFNLITNILKQKQLIKSESFDLSLALSHKLSEFVYDNDIKNESYLYYGENKDGYVLYFYGCNQENYQNLLDILSKCDYVINCDEEFNFGFFLIGDINKLRQITYEAYDNERLINDKKGLFGKIKNKIKGSK